MTNMSNGDSVGFEQKWPFAGVSKYKLTGLVIEAAALVAEAVVLYQQHPGVVTALLKMVNIHTK